MKHEPLAIDRIGGLECDAEMRSTSFTSRWASTEPRKAVTKKAFMQQHVLCFFCVVHFQMKLAEASRAVS